MSQRDQLARLPFSEFYRAKIGTLDAYRQHVAKMYFKAADRGYK